MFSRIHPFARFTTLTPRMRRIFLAILSGALTLGLISGLAHYTSLGASRHPSEPAGASTAQGAASGTQSTASVTYQMTPTVPVATTTPFKSTSGSTSMGGSSSTSSKSGGGGGTSTTGGRAAGSGVVMNDTPTPMPTVGAISPTPAPSVTAATPTTTTAPSAPTPTATTAPLLDDAQPVGPTTPVTVNQNGGSVEPYVTFKNTGPTTWHSFVTNYEVTCSAGGKIIGAILISGDIAPQQTLTAGVSMSVPSPLIATTYMVSCSMAEDVPQMNGYPVMTDFGTAMSLKFTITHATWVDGETTPYCNSQSSWTEYTASAGAVSCSGGLVFRESGGLTPRLVYTGESSSVNLNGSVVSIHVSFSSPGADNWVKFMVHASGTNYCMVDGYEIRGDGYYRLYYTTSSCAEVDGSWTPFLTTPSDYSLQITASGNIINFGINGFFVTSATIPTPIYSGGYLALSAGGTSGSSADISVSDLGIYNTFYGTTTWVMV